MSWQRTRAKVISPTAADLAQLHTKVKLNLHHPLLQRGILHLSQNVEVVSYLPHLFSEKAEAPPCGRKTSLGWSV